MSTLAPRLDRATHLRRDVDFLEAQLSDPGTLLLPLHANLHAVRDDQLVLVELRRASELLATEGELVWLGQLEQRACFGLDISALSAPLQHEALRGAELMDLRMSAARLPTAQLELAYYARGILGWHARHRFCATCGQPTRPREGGHLRLCSRASCGAQHFPRTDPCVLVLVTDAGAEHCLLGRQAAWPRGMYSTLAGFVEPGETLEQAVAREVLEETGVHVQSARYAGSQPWPFPASLMLGFVATAEPDGNELRLDDELEDARWFSRAELGALEGGLFVPGPHTLAGQLIENFTLGPTEKA